MSKKAPERVSVAVLVFLIAAFLSCLIGAAIATKASGQAPTVIGSQVEASREIAKLHTLLNRTNLSTSRPNIVVIVVDDQPALDGRLMSQQYMPKTYQAITGHAFYFPNMLSCSPLCCPARTSALTGQYAHNHKVILNQATLFNPTMSLATQLQKAGYETALSGKLLNAFNKVASKGVPPGWNPLMFDAFDDPLYVNYNVEEGQADGTLKPHFYGNTAADYSTEVVGNYAVRDIENADPNKPLFMWVAPFAEHAPMTVEQKYIGTPICQNIPPWNPPNWQEEDVSDKPQYVRLNTRKLGKGQNLRANCRTGLSVDDMVGRIADSLKSTGRYDNTLFVYMGDNGMNEGEHRLPGKAAPYGTTIPFYMSWVSGLGTTPRTIPDQLLNVDLAPTLTGIAGTTMGPYPNGQQFPDGLDFSGLLFGGSSPVTTRNAVLEEMPGQQAKGPSDPPIWYSVRTTASSPLATVGCPSASVGGCSWHYVEYATGEKELYDDSNGPYWLWNSTKTGDPAEMNNFFGPNPDWTNEDKSAIQNTVEPAVQQCLASLKAQKGTLYGPETQYNPPGC